MLRDVIESYVPFCEQEEVDRREILRLMDTGMDLMHRDFPAHFSASAWVVSPDREHILMAHHRIYHAWSWLGGHADGEEDLLSVAVREVQEECGASRVRVVSPKILSLEILPVQGHVKRGVWVSSHQHLNITYLLEVSRDEQVHAREEENTAVRWFTLSEAETVPEEAWMCEQVYAKLNRRLRSFP